MAIHHQIVLFGKYVETEQQQQTIMPVRVKYYYIIIDATICLFKVSGMNFFFCHVLIHGWPKQSKKKRRQ